MAEVRTHGGDAPGNGRRREAVGTHRGEPALELLGRRALDGLVGERAQRVEVSTVGVDGARRSPGLESQQEAFDVGVGGTHGARPDSARGRGLLSGGIVPTWGAGLQRSSLRYSSGRRATGRSSASAGADSVVAYPSSQSIAATGPLPRAGARTRLQHRDRRARERDGRRAGVRSESPRTSRRHPQRRLAVHFFFAHFVAVKGRPVADVLVPWDGAERATERSNQPVLVQVDVPQGTRPGGYAGALTVTADGRRTTVPLTVRVFPVTLPAAGTRVGNLLTSFNLSPKSYVAKAAQLYGLSSTEQRLATNNALFEFLGAYRISPGLWGFGEPRSPAGYESSPKWWRNSAGNFLGQHRASQGFSALRIPISSNRAAGQHYIAQLSPFQPESWCEYLRRVHTFWSENEVLGPSSLAYVFGYDEPGLSGQRVVARQAKVVHDCFPGGRQLMTGNPSKANAFLWDGKGGDDLDIWTVLSRRYYGRWTSSGDTKAGGSRARERLDMIQKVRSRGKMVWAYTYTGTPGTPGFAATEPLSNPRMLVLWTALEGIDGVLYAQGATGYTASSNPLESIGNGDEALLYPGPAGPMPSARLEQIRDGIEDWALFNIVRKRHGARAVREILGRAGLFSATRGQVRLACAVGCELKSKTAYAWPRWSRDASTPRRIEDARLAALKIVR